jgi:hypothetical protein
MEKRGDKLFQGFVSFSSSLQPQGGVMHLRDLAFHRRNSAVRTCFLRPRYGRYLSDQGDLTDYPEVTPHVLELLQGLAPQKSLSLQSEFLHPMMHLADKLHRVPGTFEFICGYLLDMGILSSKM